MPQLATAGQVRVVTSAAVGQTAAALVRTWVKAARVARPMTTRRQAPAVRQKPPARQATVAARAQVVRRGTALRRALAELLLPARPAATTAMTARPTAACRARA